MSFLTEQVMKGTDWRALERVIARMMSHCGWRDVRIVGRTGDSGGDVVGIREVKGEDKVFVTQVKAITGDRYVGVSAVQQVVDAMREYGADIAVAATNGDFTDSAYRRRDRLRAEGFDVRLWNGTFLRELLGRWSEEHHQKRPLRPYQEDIVGACLAGYRQGSSRVQFVVATGLGKSIMAADIVWQLFREGLQCGLVLCHSQPLALQLEQQFWSQLGRTVPTRVFYEGIPPVTDVGVSFGLFQTMVGYLSGIDPTAFDVVVVDEAHHAVAQGFLRCINHLHPKFLIGMTATPWRGDGRTIESVFGPPVARVSIIDGMKMGYLAQVDYRLYFDTIDWRRVPALARGRVSIRDLNRSLFIPQRDEAIVAEILAPIRTLPHPRIIVFCPSIEHCRRFAGLLRSSSDLVCKSVSGVDEVTRQRTLMEFATGRVQAVTAVDVLNEGIDVPDVNVLVFVRSTHSRRIFVQQLGRGLRIAPGKDKVLVLDFATDIRRIAELIDMDSDARQPRCGYQTIYFPDGIVRFVNQKDLPFVAQWLEDVTDLGDSDDSQVLSYPEATCQ